MIVNTMSKTKLETPSIESLFYFTTVVIGLLIPSIEFYIVVVQCLFIVLYFIRYFGSIINQLMKELKIETFQFIKY